MIKHCARRWWNEEKNCGIRWRKAEVRNQIYLEADVLEALADAGVHFHCRHRIQRDWRFQDDLIVTWYMPEA